MHARLDVSPGDRHHHAAPAHFAGKHGGERTGARALDHRTAGLRQQRDRGGDFGFGDGHDFVDLVGCGTIGPLAHLGDGAIAYVKTINSEDVQRLFPQAPAIRPGLRLFALLSASGAPIMLTDSKDAALANAWENQLETVSVH